LGKACCGGNVIGIALCLLQYYFKIAKLDSETYYVDAVAIEINWLYFLLLNIGTFLSCALMMFLPTLIITRLTPIKRLNSIRGIRPGLPGLLPHTLLLKQDIFSHHNLICPFYVFSSSAATCRSYGTYFFVVLRPYMFFYVSFMV